MTAEDAVLATVRSEQALLDLARHHREFTNPILHAFETERVYREAMASLATGETVRRMAESMNSVQRIVDEENRLLRMVEEEARMTRLFEAERWVLTGPSLFPESFDSPKALPIPTMPPAPSPIPVVVVGIQVPAEDDDAGLYENWGNRRRIGFEPPARDSASSDESQPRTEPSLEE